MTSQHWRAARWRTSRQGQPPPDPFPPPFPPFPSQVTPYDSIPTCMYWVVINLGDLAPTTDAGRCISCVVQLVVIFGTAFPVGVIAMEFDSAYKGEG